VCQQQHVSDGVESVEAGTRTAVALAQRSAFNAAFDQSCELLARVTAYPLEESQHHGLLCAPPTRITEPVNRAGDNAVALGREDRKIHRQRSIQKGLKLRQVG
jgi:hypothetical protein